MAEPSDKRTPDQLRHDAFAMILAVAARSAETPSIGGAAPTVLITVRQADLDRAELDQHSLDQHSGVGHSGVGHVDGIDVPISLRNVKHVMCTGNTQRVLFSDEGKLLKLTSPERCFTPGQRRAILARDGGCIIPGCNVRQHGSRSTTSTNTATAERPTPATA